MYALLRTDLSMSSGKAASQAGHAFLDSFIKASSDSQLSYLKDGGTKVVLSAPNERTLCDLYFKARKAGLPCAMVVEQDHIMPPAFDGSPIVTAIGIGPIRRSEAKPLLREFSLLK